MDGVAKDGAGGTQALRLGGEQTPGLSREANRSW